MAPEDKALSSDPAMSPEPSIASQSAHGVSRREVLTGAGILAAGVGLAGAPAPAEAGSDDEKGVIGVAKPGVNAGEFHSWILQSGPNGEAFVSFGFITKLAGLDDDDLFAGAVHDETTALLTVYSDGDLQQRVFGQNVHTLDVVGTLTIYQRNVPGASASDPASFQVGTPVARFAVTLQDVLTVFAPGRGLPTLSGDMRQTDAGRLLGIGKPFGRKGLVARVLATGLGQRPNPATFDTQFEMAGNWTIEES